MEKKICLVIGYDGTNYYGFQRQPNHRTIQQTVEEALSRLTQESIEITGSGRTDRGVHALRQVCHFVTKSSIPAEKYAQILRDQLPSDILAISSREVNLSFHARKDVCYKTYRYQIETASIPHLFERRYYTHFPFSLDVDQMQEAAKYFIGTHDFTALCSQKTAVKNRVRTIYDCQVKQQKQKVWIEITGDGFLYNMVRIIAGTLYQVGRNKLESKEMKTIIQSKNRALAGPTLPPEGLILMHVSYTPWNAK